MYMIKKKAPLTPEKADIIASTYQDPALGFQSAQALFKTLKPSNPTITMDNIKEWFDNQETHQVNKARSTTYHSYVAHEPLDQFQIDLVYMPKAMFNKGYKYIFTAVDIFSKKAAMIPMKERDAETSAAVFEKILKRLGIPKTIYSDQGSEFQNAPFNAVLEKHNISIIFALDHAPFIEALNKTIKTRLYKYMAYKDTQNWSDALDILVNAYNNTPHSSTRISPNNITEENETQARMNMLRRARTKKYEEIEVGDKVRVPIIHKVKKGYKQQWTLETHTVEALKGEGVYEVDGALYPRKELQLVKGEPVKLPPKTAKEIKKNDLLETKEKISNSKLLKELSNDAAKKKKAHYLLSQLQ